MLDADAIRQMLKNLGLATLTATCLCASPFAAAEPPVTEIKSVLRQAALYQQQFRTGNVAILPDYLAMLEQATMTTTDNADLWYAMGVAHFANAAGAVRGTGSIDMAAVAPMYQKGSAALERALQLDPEHPEAIALRAGTRLMLAAFARKPEVIAVLRESAIAEMNRAIALDPDSKRARLQRAFSGLTLPEEFRNHANEAADLEWLMAVSKGSQSGDYISLMRADLYFEQGDYDEAREMYEKVQRSSSPAALVATKRLSAMEAGRISTDSIMTLRRAAGADCGMCHDR